MSRSRGELRFEPLFTTEDIGVRKDASVEHIIKVFLHVGDQALATRWIEMPRGILLLQSAPNRPDSGAIYLYDRGRHTFFAVTFSDGQEDTLTASEFDQLVSEYSLVTWTGNPESIPIGMGQPGLA